MQNAPQCCKFGEWLAICKTAAPTTHKEGTRACRSKSEAPEGPLHRRGKAKPDRTAYWSFLSSALLSLAIGTHCEARKASPLRTDLLRAAAPGDNPAKETATPLAALPGRFCVSYPDHRPYSSAHDGPV